jgi:ATP-dependent DNA helicase RecQ
MVYGLQDVVRLRQMLDESDAAEEYKRHERGKLDALLGWCEVTGCRRRPLLAYFGDDVRDDCGNCDGCLTPAATWDGTEDAQKFLSAVYRTGQRFGAAHVIDVLLGKATEKAEQNGHTGLSVFGIGAGRDAKSWRSIVRQLIVGNVLRADADRYGALVLTEDARPLLRGETSIRFREEPKTATRSSGASTSTASASLRSEDQPLWEALRACRQRLASEHGVPPYVIFHDRTLLEMVDQRPRNDAEMLAVNGIGQSKLERYGSEFLAILDEHAVVPVADSA